MSDDHSNDKRGKSKKSKGRKSGKAYDKRKNMFNDNDMTRHRILGYDSTGQRHLAVGSRCVNDETGQPDDSMCDTANGEFCNEEVVILAVKRIGEVHHASQNGSLIITVLAR